MMKCLPAAWIYVNHIFMMECMPLSSITLPRIFLLLLALYVSPQMVFAHGDLDKRIKKASKEIKENPNDPALYLKRGELYFQHEEYKKSIDDYKMCVKLDMDSNLLNFRFAQSYEKKNAHKKALRHLDKILKTESEHVKAWRLKGLVLYKEKKFCDAATCYENVLTFAKESFTENYLDASKAWEHCKKKGQAQNATEVIQRGLENLGTLNVFYQRLVYLYQKEKNFTAALDFQNKIITSLKRKEHAFYKRALIHKDAENPTAAKEDLQMSLDLIAALPRRFRKTKAIIDLKNKVQDLRKKLKNIGKSKAYVVPSVEKQF